MPATPGTSTEVTSGFSLVSSTTWDPFVGVEVGRTYVAPSEPTTRGATGTDTIKAK